MSFNSSSSNSSNESSSSSSSVSSLLVSTPFVDEKKLTVKTWNGRDVTSISLSDFLRPIKESLESNSVEKFFEIIGVNGLAAGIFWNIQKQPNIVDSESWEEKAKRLYKGSPFFWGRIFQQTDFEHSRINLAAAGIDSNRLETTFLGLATPSEQTINGDISYESLGVLIDGGFGFAAGRFFQYVRDLHALEGLFQSFSCSTSSSSSSFSSSFEISGSNISYSVSHHTLCTEMNDPSIERPSFLKNYFLDTEAFMPFIEKLCSDSQPYVYDVTVGGELLGRELINQVLKNQELPSYKFFQGSVIQCAEEKLASAVSGICVFQKTEEKDKTRQFADHWTKVFKDKIKSFSPSTEEDNLMFLEAHVCVERLQGLLVNLSSDEDYLMAGRLFQQLVNLVHRKRLFDVLPVDRQLSEKEKMVYDRFDDVLLSHQFLKNAHSLISAERSIRADSNNTELFLNAFAVLIKCRLELGDFNGLLKDLKNADLSIENKKTLLQADPSFSEEDIYRAIQGVPLFSIQTKKDVLIAELRDVSNKLMNDVKRILNNILKLPDSRRLTNDTVRFLQSPDSSSSQVSNDVDVFEAFYGKCLRRLSSKKESSFQELLEILYDFLIPEEFKRFVLSKDVYIEDAKQQVKIDFEKYKKSLSSQDAMNLDASAKALGIIRNSAKKRRRKGKK